jgi:hypothetical protein
MAGVNGFELFAPFSKIDERTGEFEAWATIEEIDASGEIIDLDKSWPYFEALAKQFSDATGGTNFGPLREQHDPQKASGHLIAPPVIKTHPSGKRGVFINGLPTDPITKEKIVKKTLTGISIGGDYVGAKENVTVDGRAAKKFVAKPGHYAPCDSPCVKGALVTMVKVDGSQVQEPLRKDVTQFWDCGVGGCIAKHTKKGDARTCLGVLNKAADLCGCCTDGGCDCASLDGDACACHADCSKCEDADCGGLAEKVAKISAEARNALDDADFALPGRRYPIDTRARARKAIAQVAEHGTESDQKKVRAAVYAKYPDLDPDKATDTSEKAVRVTELQKSLWNISNLTSALSTILCAISDEEYEETWEAVQAIREGKEPDAAGMNIVAQLKQLAADLFDALEAILAEERAELDDDVYGPLAMAAIGGALQKSATAKQLLKQLNKSLRVHKGNGSTTTQHPKEALVSTATENVTPVTETTKEEVKPVVAPETVVTKAEPSCNYPDDPTGHMHVGGLCKAEKIDATAAAVIKALGGKLDGFGAELTKRDEKITELEGAVATLVKTVARMGNMPAAPPAGALRAAPIAKSVDASNETFVEKPVEEPTIPVVKYGETGAAAALALMKTVVAGGIQTLDVPPRNEAAA